METIDQSTIIANNIFYLLFPGNQPYRRFKMPQKCGFFFVFYGRFTC